MVRGWFQVLLGTVVGNLYFAGFCAVGTGAWELGRLL